MTTSQHADGPQRPDTDDLGFSDDAEERAYRKAGEGSPPDAPAEHPEQPHPEPIEVAENAVDAQAEPDTGEPENAG